MALVLKSIKHKSAKKDGQTGKYQPGAKLCKYIMAVRIRHRQNDIYLSITC